MTLTDREQSIVEWVRTFAPEQRSGELVIRFRDGEPVQVVPQPVVKIEARKG